MGTRQGTVGEEAGHDPSSLRLQQGKHSAPKPRPRGNQSQDYDEVTQIVFFTVNGEGDCRPRPAPSRVLFVDGAGASVYL